MPEYKKRMAKDTDILAAVALSWRGMRAVAEEFRRRGSSGHGAIYLLSRSTAPLVI